MRATAFDTARALWGPVALLALAVNVPANAQAWVGLDLSSPGTPPEVILDPGSDEDSTTFTVVTHGFYIEPILVNNVLYQRIVIPSPFNAGITGYSFDYEVSPSLSGDHGVGLPELPYDAEIVGIVTDAPWGTLGGVVVEESLDYGPVNVYPQQPGLKNCDCCNVPGPFQIDQAFYASAGFFPAAEVELDTPDPPDGAAEWLTTKVSSAKVNITQFDPATQILRIKKRIRVTINHIGNLIPPALRPDNYPDADAIYQRLMVNWTKVKNFANAVVQSGYLIIVHDDYVNAIQPLAAAKTAEGFTVTIKQVPTDVCQNVNCIKNAIKDFYDASRGAFGPWVLLVGDVDKVPTNDYTQFDGTETGPSDTMYAMVKGNDWYPDVFIGRITGDDANGIGRVVAKTNHYQQGKTKGDWPTKVLLASHRENFPGKYTAAQRAVKNNVLDKANPVPTTLVAEGGAANNNNNTYVSDSINNWLGVIGYNGHGKPPRWAGWGNGGQDWSIAQVNALTNGCRTPVIMSTACKNARISEEDCIAEEWLEVGKARGAAAHYGSSQDTWTTQSNQLNERFFRQRYLDPGWERVGRIVHYAAVSILHDNPPTRPNLKSKGTDIVAYYVLVSDPTLNIRISQLNGASAPCCTGDVDGSGAVGIGDFLAVLNAWGPNAGNPADVTGDGVVNIIDLLLVLALWGPCL